MKFIVDAQLPRRLAHELTAAGHDAKHTWDFPSGNRATDREISEAAIREDRVIVTKDHDFVTFFQLRGAPPKLLLISTGNISNDALSKLLGANIAALETAFTKYDFVELSVSTITVHA